MKWRGIGAGRMAVAVGILIVSSAGKKAEPAAPTGLSGRIGVSGAWALYPMMVKWVEEFRKVNPEVRIDISAGGAGKGMADALSQTVDLGMISREINPVEVSKGAWWVSVVKDAVVPTINSANPAFEAVMKRGLTSNDFAAIWVGGTITSWTSFVPGGKEEIPIHVYTRSDACGAAETWAKYLGGNQQDLKAVGVYGDPGLAEAVRKDSLGIGYNNIGFVYDPKSKRPVDGMGIIPIDINDNGQVDPEERFYSTVDELTQAIADGRYPSPPARALHLVALGAPKKEVVAQFLRWILTDGQKYVSQAGYISLPEKRLGEEMKKLQKPE